MSRSFIKNKPDQLILYSQRGVLIIAQSSCNMRRTSAYFRTLALASTAFKDPKHSAHVFNVLQTARQASCSYSTKVLQHTQTTTQPAAIAGWWPKIASVFRAQNIQSKPPCTDSDKWCVLLQQICSVHLFFQYVIQAERKTTGKFLDA